MANKIKISKSQKTQRYVVTTGKKETIIIDKSGEYIVELIGEGAEAQIFGVITGKGDRKFTIKTMQRHKAPNTKSNLLIKSVLSDSSQLRYDGLIKIDKEAQNSDAYLRNENIVEGGKVFVQTKPDLEIEANNVRCTHAVTIGKIDKEQLFYLKSRGLSEKQAKNLIIKGFFKSIFDKIKDRQVRKRVKTKI